MQTSNIKYILLFLLISAQVSVFGRSNLIPTGSKAAGMANAFVSQYDVFSVFHNQAGLAKIERTSVSFFYENKFFVEEMSTRAAVITFPAGNGSFGINYNAFGPTQWAESNVGIAYSRFLNEKLSAGLQLNYFGTRLPEIDKTEANYSFEFGAIYQLTEKTALGAHIANPYASAFKTLVYTESIPWRISVGGHTNFTEEFMFAYEIEAIQSNIPALQIGVQWEAAENFFLRGGYDSGINRFSTGFGYISKFLTIDTAFSYNQYMGYTPSVSVIFSFF